MDTGEIELGEESLKKCVDDNPALNAQLRIGDETARKEFDSIMAGWTPPWPDANGDTTSTLTDNQIAVHLKDLEQFMEKYPAGYHFKLAVTVKALLLYHRSKYSACLRWLTEKPSALPDFAIYISALCSLKLNDHSTAFALVDSLLSKHPQSLYASRAGMMKAALLMEEERFRSAIDAVMNVATSSDDPFTKGEALLLASQIYVKGGDLQTAKTIALDIAMEYPVTDVSDFLETRIDPAISDFTNDDAIVLSEYFSRKNRGYPIVKYLSKRKNLNYRASYLLARGYFLSGNIKESEKLLGALNSKSVDEKTRGEACLLNADIYKSKSKYDSAISQLTSCMANYQALHRDALERMALLYLITDNTPARIKTLTRLLEVAPDHEMSGEYLLEVARSNLISGRRAEALNIYKTLIDAQPPKYAAAEALFWTAKIHFDSGNEAYSAEHFRLAMKRFPYSYYYFRSRDYLLAMNESAPSFYEKAFVERKSPGYEPVGNLYLMGGHALRHMNLYEESIRHFTAASAQNPDRAAIGIARALRDLGKMPESVKSIENRVKINPELYYQVIGSPYLSELLFPTLYIDKVKTEASKIGMSAAWPLAIIRQESRFKADATSRSNARGLMQIIPSTGKWIAGNLKDKRYKLDRLYEPDMNVRYGVWYFDHLLGIKELQGNTALAVASYNGGPGNVKKWINQYGLSDIDLFVEKIPRDETRGYVKKVLLNYYTYEALLEAHDGQIGDYKNMNLP